MRKVHYQVILDVFTNEDDNADGVGILEEATFWPDIGDCYNKGVDIQDIIVESVRVTDSR